MTDNTRAVLEELTSRGARHASCVEQTSERRELCVDNGKMNLFRTAIDRKLSMLSIIGGREGKLSLNRTDADSIKRGADDVTELARAAMPDSANGISERQPEERFSQGPVTCDNELLFGRAEELLRDTSERFEKISLQSAYLSHNIIDSVFRNTNGVCFGSKIGYYSASLTFMANDGEKTSSFNYTGFLSPDLSQPIIDTASVSELFRQCEEQLYTKSAEGKFDGEVIFSPDCFDSILEGFCGTYLSDTAIVSGVSPLKDSAGKRVASKLLTVRSCPTTMQGGYFVTGDGYKAQNCDIIRDGILRNYTLGRYAAEKTGLARSPNRGGFFDTDAGNESLEELIGGIARGLLVCRYSGGNPTKNGDISGVAKNSYYIEDGEIKYPVSETMISGNLEKMFMNINGVSDRRIDYGCTVLPFVRTAGVTIIGK